MTGLRSSAPARSAPQKRAILAVLCTCVLTILVDTSIVNVTLPTLTRELDASTRDLLWIVDAYNLTFAGFVLAAGSLGDRLGRKRILMAGLAVFGTATLVGSFVDGVGALVACRAVMGIGAAMIFPSTLSILTNVFVQREERAKAIGIWGATTGIAIALSPICGGALLSWFWWGSVFAAMAPLAFGSLIAVAVLVPESRDEHEVGFDLPGLITSIAALTLLVYTIIEAPEAGWASARTLAGLVAALGLIAGFAWWQVRTPNPMLDVRLFRNLRFSAASGSVAMAFFATAGFMFLISQYFQLVKGHSALATGVRFLPCATTIAVVSIIGTKLALKIGNRVVIATGLGLLAIAFVWMSTLSAATSYLEVVGQMVLSCTGLALVNAPATEAIMGAVPANQASIGSAVNDATREIGGTLGVALLGSVFVSLYASSIDALGVGTLDGGVLDAARNGLGAALEMAPSLGEPGLQLAEAANRGFFDGLQAACLVGAGLLAVAAVFAGTFIPARPSPVDRAGPEGDASESMAGDAASSGAHEVPVT
jgi:EmrB/QacA subfamily drug resistance transporter